MIKRFKSKHNSEYENLRSICWIHWFIKNNNNAPSDIFCSNCVLLENYHASHFYAFSIPINLPLHSPIKWFKVHTIWEGHKIWRNLHISFDVTLLQPVCYCHKYAFMIVHPIRNFPLSTLLKTEREISFKVLWPSQKSSTLVHT